MKIKKPTPQEVKDHKKWSKTRSKKKRKNFGTMANWADIIADMKPGVPAKEYKDKDGNIIITNSAKVVKDKNLIPVQ